MCKCILYKTYYFLRGCRILKYIVNQNLNTFLHIHNNNFCIIIGILVFIKMST